MLYGWEGGRRSGVTQAMHHRLSGIAVYGLNSLENGDEHSASLRSPMEHGNLPLPCATTYNATQKASRNLTPFKQQGCWTRWQLWITRPSKDTHIYNSVNLSIKHRSSSPIFALQDVVLETRTDNSTDRKSNKNSTPKIHWPRKKSTVLVTVNDSQHLHAYSQCIVLTLHRRCTTKTHDINLAWKTVCIKSTIVTGVLKAQQLNRLEWHKGWCPNINQSESTVSSFIYLTMQ